MRDCKLPMKLVCCEGSEQHGSNVLMWVGPLQEVHFDCAPGARQREDEHGVGFGVGLEPMEGAGGDARAEGGGGARVPEPPEVFDFGGGKGGKFGEVHVGGEGFDSRGKGGCGVGGAGGGDDGCVWGGRGDCGGGREKVGG